MLPSYYKKPFSKDRFASDYTKHTALEMYYLYSKGHQDASKAYSKLSREKHTHIPLMPVFSLCYQKGLTLSPEVSPTQREQSQISL